MVLQELERVGLEQTLQVVEGLGPHEAALLRDGLIHDLMDRCSHDGLFWLRFVRTRDEADPQASVKRFPVQLEYLNELWTLLVRQQCIVVAKSRQMLVSWAVCAFCVWWARFKAHQAIYWQTQQWKDACSMTATPEGSFPGRCQFIEQNLPPWMHLSIKASEGSMSYPNGSIIQALAGGADQIRGKVASIYVGDEFAHQSEATGTWTAVSPLVQKGAKAILVSTPNGTGNIFSTLYHGHPVGGPA